MTLTNWQSSPTGRGTWDILKSCIATLVITCWTVIHDEVVHNGTSQERLMSKIVWMIYTVLQPELTALCAVYQWMMARDLHKWWCKRFGVTPGSDEDRLGREGAFCVIMGGYTVGPCDYYGRYPKLLDAPSFMKLMEDGAISPSSINKQLIRDRGKADAIAKAVSTLQALSLLVQCIARVASHLPVTLLELHVLTNVFWAVLIYALWWHKPLGLCEPMSVIEHEEIGNALAIIYVQDKDLLVAILPSSSSPSSSLTASSMKVNQESEPATTSNCRHASISTDAPPSLTPQCFDVDILGQESVPHNNTPLEQNGPDGDESGTSYKVWTIQSSSADNTEERVLGNGNDIEKVVILKMNRSLTGNSKSPISGWSRDQFAQRRRGNEVILSQGESLLISHSILIRFCGMNSDETIELSGEEIKELEKEAGLIRNVTQTENDTEMSLSTSADSGPKHDYQAAFIGSIPEKSYNGEMGLGKCVNAIYSRPGKGLQADASVLIGIGYTLTAAGHLLAWNSSFPTTTEMWLWRISCIGLVGPPWLWFVIELLFIRPKSYIKGSLIRLPITIMTIVFSLYLVVESFIAIRAMPVSTYETPDWVSLLPSI